MCCIRRVFRFDAAFACVVCVVRVVAALTCGAQRFLFSVSECARDAPKFDGARASKIFALEGARTASETWVGYKQRFLLQVCNLTCCSIMQRLGLRAKRLAYSLMWCSTIVQFSEYSRSLSSID